MAHVQKFPRGSVGGLSSHIERKTLNHSNKEIDNEQSHENYDLCEKDEDMNARYKERMDDVHCLNRADVKTMADWVVTLPEELNEGSEASKKRFFEESYDFLSDRYGKENVLAGVVHNDETTPHMHFAFIPVTFDENKQREKVSAKEVLNRKDLKAFHQDLDNHLKERIPEIYQKGVLNNKTIGIDDIPTLKEKSKEIEQLDQNLKSSKLEYKLQSQKVEKIKTGLSNVNDTQKKIDKLEYNMSRTVFGNRVIKPKELNEFKKFVTGLQKSTVKSVVAAQNLEEENSDLNKDFRKTSKKLDSVSSHRDNLIDDNQSLETKVKHLDGENSDLEDDLTVADSKLKDLGQERSKMSQIEIKGHLVVDRLENGYEPKNKKVADNWHGILEENKEKKLISGERLNNAMQELKKIMQKMLDKIKDIGLSL